MRTKIKLSPRKRKSIKSARALMSIAMGETHGKIERIKQPLRG